jgi:hypothetical protein|tara:strand:- start:896 stop:1159 length:264 start_codon:yes stop_codon:yes gene_type:complete
MKISELKKLIREVLHEMNEISATGTGATFTPGSGAQYATPYAFGKKGKKNKATQYGEKLGFKTVKRKKRPYNTKMYDYLDENNTRKI